MSHDALDGGRPLRALVATAVLGLVACVGYRTPLDPEATASGPRPDAAVGADARARQTCSPAQQYVLGLGSNDRLYRVDLAKLTLTQLADVDCRGADLNSLTVAPGGPAYVSTAGGDLCLVDLATFRVDTTMFAPAAVGGSPFGMALLPSTSATSGYALYLAVRDTLFGNRLYRMDIATGVLSEVGPILPSVDWAELTAGPDGSLYGFSPGATQSLLLDIDATTGSAIDVTTVPAGFEYAAFALVYWQDAFYLFIGPAGPSSEPGKVFRYRKGDTTVSQIGTLPVPLIGAGVACPAP